jgi:hypothetical protein
MINTDQHGMGSLSARNRAQHVNTENANLEGYTGSRGKNNLTKSIRVFLLYVRGKTVLTVLIRFVRRLVGVAIGVDPC